MRRRRTPQLAHGRGMRWRNPSAWSWRKRASGGSQAGSPGLSVTFASFASTERAHRPKRARKSINGSASSQARRRVHGFSLRTCRRAAGYRTGVDTIHLARASTLAPTPTSPSVQSNRVSRMRGWIQKLRRATAIQRPRGNSFEAGCGSGSEDGVCVALSTCAQARASSESAAPNSSSRTIRSGSRSICLS